jgi:hypothetical protein
MNQKSRFGSKDLDENSDKFMDRWYNPLLYEVLFCFLAPLPTLSPLGPIFFSYPLPQCLYFWPMFLAAQKIFSLFIELELNILWGRLAYA